MKTNCYIEKSNNRAYLANWSVPCQVLQVLNVFFFCLCTSLWKAIVFVESKAPNWEVVSCSGIAGRNFNDRCAFQYRLLKRK